MKAVPIGKTLGAAIEGLDLSKPLTDEEFRARVEEDLAACDEPADKACHDWLLSRVFYLAGDVERAHALNALFFSRSSQISRTAVIACSSSALMTIWCSSSSADPPASSTRNCCPVSSGFALHRRGVHRQTCGPSRLCLDPRRRNRTARVLRVRHAAAPSALPASVYARRSCTNRTDAHSSCTTPSRRRRGRSPQPRRRAPASERRD